MEDSDEAMLAAGNESDVDILTSSSHDDDRRAACDDDDDEGILSGLEISEGIARQRPASSFVETSTGLGPGISGGDRRDDLGDYYDGDDSDHDDEDHNDLLLSLESEEDDVLGTLEQRASIFSRPVAGYGEIMDILGEGEYGDDEMLDMDGEQDNQSMAIDHTATEFVAAATLTAVDRATRPTVGQGHVRAEAEAERIGGLRIDAPSNQLARVLRPRPGFARVDLAPVTETDDSDDDQESRKSVPNDFAPFPAMLLCLGQFVADLAVRVRPRRRFSSPMVGRR
jgi:hypothetical protein